MIKFLRWLADQDIFNFHMYAIMNFTAQDPKLMVYICCEIWYSTCDVIFMDQSTI